MSVKVAKVQFNGGEISPWLEGRFDLAKYDKTAKLCRNFIPMAEGSLKRRGGSVFVTNTVESESVVFRINAVPLNAKIVINGIECSYMHVSRGDEISYEVLAEGYKSSMGKVVVEDNMDLDVVLVSKSEMCNFSINTYPVDAIVKIDGFEQRSAEFYKNTWVNYVVYADGYELKSGSVLLKENTVLEVVLDEVKETGDEYGDWGDAIGFVACSVVGDISKQLKCFYLKFSNGYLPVVFDANSLAPDSNYFIDESLFFYSLRDGYNAICKIGNDFVHSRIEKSSDAVRYRDLDGNLICGFDGMTMGIVGWPLDENNKYAAIYTAYDGVVSNNIFKIYYKGNLIWELKGRDNG